MPDGGMPTSSRRRACVACGCYRGPCTATAGSCCRSRDTEKSAALLSSTGTRNKDSRRTDRQLGAPGSSQNWVGASLSAMRMPSAAASPSALRLVARVGLLYACASDVRPEWASLRASELSALLRARGVDTSGVFERAELLRLLAAAPEPGPAGQAAGDQPLPRVNDMPMGDVMDELDRRGVRFDVLAPPQKISRLLVQARRRAPLEARPPPAPRGSTSVPQWAPPPPPPSTPPPPPSTPSASASASPPWGRPAAAQPATDGGATPAAAGAAPPRQPQPPPPLPLQPPAQPGETATAEPAEPTAPG